MAHLPRTIRVRHEGPVCFGYPRTEHEITQKLDANYLEYTNPIIDSKTTEFYLKGGGLRPAELLARFPERWPSHYAASSGSDT